MGDLTVSEVLSKAADLIERRGGWARGSWGYEPGRFDDGCYCMMGAVARAAEIDPGDLDDAPQFVAAIHAVVPQIEDLADATAWNDRAGRRKHHVVSALREASKLPPLLTNPARPWARGVGDEAVSAVFICDDAGRLRYRGTVHDRGLFERLRALFAAEPWPHEREYVAQIDAALSKYDAIHSQQEKAA